MARQIPNTRLRKLVSDAGWTGDAFARAVNVVGAESGISLQYRRSAVSHWLSGMHPRPPVPELIAEALSRRLGYPVSVADRGLSGTPSDVQDGGPDGRWPWGQDPRDLIADLAAEVIRDPSMLTRHIYNLAALEGSWADSNTETPGHREMSADARIGKAQVAAGKAMLPLFSDTDSAFGGGHARNALALYLGRTVVAWVRADATAKVRQEMQMLAARLAYLCGFMNFDEQLHGAAQQYYLAGFRIAEEAGDLVGRALALRALSVQADALGHRRQSVNLAQAAIGAEAGNGDPRTRAFLCGQLAVAHASAGDRRDALAQLINAERHLERASARSEPIGGYHRASLAHQRAAVALHLGDRAEAEVSLQRAVRDRPVNERRSRIVILARLAELQSAMGHLERACQTWERFLEDYPHLRSARADRALANLHRITRPHSGNPSVQHLNRSVALMSAGARTGPR